MAKLQHKRGTTAKRLAYTPAEGEIIHDQTLNKIFIGNGTTAGGVAIQADDDSRIPKMESLSGGKRYAELVQRYYASASQVGAMVIHLPVAKATSNTMLMVNIRGYNYQSNFAPFDLMVGFYQYSASNSILQFGASCNGVFPGERVRIGRAADHTVIILGDVGTVWAYPTLRVAELIASYGSQDGWESGWSINCETDLSGYVNLVEPVLYGSSRAKKADILTTARTINGVSFNGSANITVADSTKVPLTGGTITGNLTVNGILTGTTVEATKLKTSQTISMTGDGTWSANFDGSAAATGALSLSTTGVTPGTYKSLTVDAKGRVTAADDVVTGLVTSTTATGTTNAVTANTNTYLNVVEKIGTANASAGTSTQITGAGTVTVASDAAGKLTITGAQSISGNAATASRLTSTDDRDVKPADTTKRALSSYFTSLGGMTGDANSLYGDLLVLNGYSDTSGGRVNALYFPKSGTGLVPGIYHYTAAQADTTWGVPEQLAYMSSNVASATKLNEARQLSITGDASWSVSFDGTANVTAGLSLSNTGVIAGTYKSVTVDTKGRVTAGAEVVTGLVTATSATGTANQATTNTNTYLNVVEKVGTAAASAGTSTQITGAGSVTVTSDTAGKLTITGAQNITGTAERLASQGNVTALVDDELPPNGLGMVQAYSNGYPTPYGNVIQLGGGGKGEILVGWSGVAGGLAPSFIRSKRDVSGSPWSEWREILFRDMLDTLTVGKATTLASPRGIGGVNFDGSTSINLPGVNIEGNQDTTGNAATATKLQNFRTINAVDFDGSENIVLGQVIRQGVDWDTLLEPNNYSVQTVSGTNRPVTNFGTLTVTGLGSRVTQTFTTDEAIPSVYVRMALAGVWNPWEKMLSQNNGVALAAKKLENSVNINGVAFDGTTNINTPVFSTGNAGLVPARVGSVSTKYLREDGTWVTPTNTTYSAMTQAEIDAGTGTTARIISPSLLKSAVLKHAPVPGTDNALFLGSITWFNGPRNKIPAGYTSADGQLLTRTTYPELWAAVNSGVFRSVSESDWTLDERHRGCYSTGDGTSTFRLPDLNGVVNETPSGLFLRGDGGGTIASETVLPGNVLKDAIRNITGNVGNFRADSATYYTHNGVFQYTSSATAYTGFSNTTGAIMSFDASRVVPTAQENRPVSAVGIWIIRVNGGTSPLPASGSPASLLNNTFDGNQRINGNVEVNGDLNLGGASLLESLNNLLGVGQTWQSMIGQRASGTIYQNTTGKPIAVVIGGASNEQQAQCSADSVTWVNVGNIGKSGSHITSTSFIVPNQHYYRITAGVSVWSELR